MAKVALSRAHGEVLVMSKTFSCYLVREVLTMAKITFGRVHREVLVMLRTLSY
jgi:hypothetical protein